VEFCLYPDPTHISMLRRQRNKQCVVPSGMLRHVALVRADISEELSASFISLRRLLVTYSVVPSSPILVTLMEALSSSNVGSYKSHTA
jgi:hypothetical protein